MVVTLAPADADAQAFAFTQGQYLTFRKSFDGEEVRRSYSICSGIDDGEIRIGVKRVDGGRFSAFANEALKAGDVLEAMPPAGSFHAPLDAEFSRHHLMFAAGSGITPVLGLIRTTLSREPKSRITLVYGNRSANTIMFREELEDLKNTHLGRLSIVHVLKTEQDVDLFTGRITAQKCRDLFARWIDIGSVDLAFICGPEGMMLEVASALREAGIPDERIKFELFATAAQPRGENAPPKPAAASAPTALTVVLDGVAREIAFDRGSQTILEAALAAELDAPYACKGGVCSTCRAKLVSGEVEMDVNYALEDYEVAAGYVLTCQSRALSEKVVVDYDQ